MAVIVAVAKQGLDTVPSGTINQRLVVDVIPGAPLFDLSDVGPVPQEVVNRTAGKR